MGIVTLYKCDVCGEETRNSNEVETISLAVLDRGYDIPVKRFKKSILCMGCKNRMWDLQFREFASLEFDSTFKGGIKKIEDDIEELGVDFEEDFEFGESSEFEDEIAKVEKGEFIFEEEILEEDVEEEDAEWEDGTFTFEEDNEFEREMTECMREGALGEGRCRIEDFN